MDTTQARQERINMLSRIRASAGMDFEASLAASDSSEVHYDGLAPEIIPHSEFRRALASIASVHLHYLRTGDPIGLRLIGASGTGKSELLRYYHNLHPASDSGLTSSIPVVYIDTPARPTAKSLPEEFLYALGVLGYRSQKESRQTRRVIDLIRECRVELLIIDEVQHLIDNGLVDRRAISDWLKTLVTKTRIPIVLAGLPRLESLISIRDDGQLRRRIPRRHVLRSFSDLLEEHQDWSTPYRQVLKRLHDRLPKGSAILHSSEITKRMMYASNGLICQTYQIVSGATELACQHHCPVTLEMLAMSFEINIWQEAPEELNPFISGAELRFLRENGEPYGKPKNHDA